MMAIGDQYIGTEKLTYSDLKIKYDDLIKEAILKANPNLEVTRADDVSVPGTITTDIITRIMHSNYVVADVTYPNPNVFYELGLRHACHPGTIIIKDKNGPTVPFDIAHLRHIEYENTPSGLRALSDKIKQYMVHFDNEPTRPDNHFLELAKLTHYEFPEYKKEESLPPEVDAILGLISSPELLELIIKQQSGENIDTQDMMKSLMNNPKVLVPFLTAMTKSGNLSFDRLFKIREEN